MDCQGRYGAFPEGVGCHSFFTPFLSFKSDSVCWQVCHFPGGPVAETLSSDPMQGVPGFNLWSGN